MPETRERSSAPHRVNCVPETNTPLSPTVPAKVMEATPSSKKEDASSWDQGWWPELWFPLAGVVLWPFLGAAMVVLAVPHRRLWLGGLVSLLFVISVIQLMRAFVLRERRLLAKSKGEPKQ